MVELIGYEGSFVNPKYYRLLCMSQCVLTVFTEGNCEKCVGILSNWENIR